MNFYSMLFVEYSFYKQREAVDLLFLLMGEAMIDRSVDVVNHYSQHLLMFPLSICRQSAC